MHKQSIVDQIEITRNGSLQIRIAREILDDDGSVLSKDWHRTSMAPGIDVDAHLAMVNEYLTESLKGAPVAAKCIERVKAVANAVWTADVIADIGAQAAD